MDARRVLVAWIVAAQLLAYPFVAFAALMGLVAVPLRAKYWGPILMIVAVSILVETAVAFVCATALRAHLRGRLRYSPVGVALASSVGLLAATLLAGALGSALLSDGAVAMEPLVMIPALAVFLGLGSGLGTVLGCRYPPG